MGDEAVDETCPARDTPGRSDRPAANGRAQVQTQGTVKARVGLARSAGRALRTIVGTHLVSSEFAEGTVAPCDAAHKGRACGGSRSRLSPHPPEQRTAAPSSPLRRRRLAFLPGEEAADVRAVAEDDEERDAEQAVDGVAVGGQRGDAERPRDSRQRPTAGDPQGLAGTEPA